MTLQGNSAPHLLLHPRYLLHLPVEVRPLLYMNQVQPPPTPTTKMGREYVQLLQILKVQLVVTQIQLIPLPIVGTKLVSWHLLQIQQEPGNTATMVKV
jgi:hypothetical protein